MSTIPLTSIEHKHSFDFTLPPWISTPFLIFKLFSSNLFSLRLALSLSTSLKSYVKWMWNPTSSKN